MTFSTHIRTKRERLGYSVWKLHKLSGVSITLIQGIEAGNGCRLTTAFKLLKALGQKTIEVDSLQV